MSDPYFGPFPATTTAYHLWGVDKCYGTAARGSKTSDPRWMIMMMDYTGDDWIIKYPNGDNSPKYVWDDVETYNYYLLGTTQ